MRFPAKCAVYWEAGRIGAKICMWAPRVLFGRALLFCYRIVIVLHVGADCLIQGSDRLDTTIVAISLPNLFSLTFAQ